MVPQKVNRHTHTQTDQSTYRKHRPMLWKRCQPETPRPPLLLLLLSWPSQVKLDRRVTKGTRSFKKSELSDFLSQAVIYNLKRKWNNKLASDSGTSKPWLMSASFSARTLFVPIFACSNPFLVLGSQFLGWLVLKVTITSERLFLDNILK